MFLGKTPPRTARIRYARDYFLFLSVTSVTCSSLVEEEEGRLGGVYTECFFTLGVLKAGIL